MWRSNFDLETLIERIMGEVVENTDEPSFGEGQDEVLAKDKFRRRRRQLN